MPETNRSTRRTLLHSLLASLFALFFVRLPAFPIVSAANRSQGDPALKPEPPSDWTYHEYGYDPEDSLKSAGWLCFRDSDNTAGLREATDY